MRGEHLFLTCGVLAVLGGTFWHLAHATLPAHAVVAVDGSISVEPNCIGLRDAAKSLLENKPGIRDGSLLSVLVMGTNERKTTPTLAVSGPIPVPSDLVYGQGNEEFGKGRERFFAQLVKACQTAEVGRSSPIYELVRQAVAHLRSGAMACGPQGKCYVLIKTDLEEDVHPGLGAALEAGAKDPAAILPTELAGSIENAGITVKFCGLLETRARHEKSSPSSSVDTRVRMWKDLFSQPQLVSFEPYCSQ